MESSDQSHCCWSL